MSQFQVGFVIASFGEADMLVQYINHYLCDKKFFIREWREQCKAVSFITQWMHATIPRLITKFKFETRQIERLESPEAANIPGDSFNKNLMCLFTVLDMTQEIYNFRLSSNTDELLQRLLQHFTSNFGEPKPGVLKEEYLQKSRYNVSVFYVVVLQTFGQSGGFELLKLMLRGPSRQDHPDISDRYTPSFQLFSQVMSILFSQREYFEPQFFRDLVVEIRDLSLDYAENRMDQDSLRSVTKRDFNVFVHNIESLLNFSVRNQRDEARDFRNEVYKYTEQIELELALHCLKLPVLEKKFIGHAILAQKINQVKDVPASEEKTDPTQINSSSTAQNAVSVIHSLRQRWLTKDKLLSWIEKNQIFSMMFSESHHPEVINKSQFLLEFLYVNNKVGEE